MQTYIHCTPTCTMWQQVRHAVSLLGGTFRWQRVRPNLWLTPRERERKSRKILTFGRFKSHLNGAIKSLKCVLLYSVEREHVQRSLLTGVQAAETSPVWHNPKKKPCTHTRTLKLQICMRSSVCVKGVCMCEGCVCVYGVCVSRPCTWSARVGHNPRRMQPHCCCQARAAPSVRNLL